MKSESLKVFVGKLAKYYPQITYKKALQFAHSDPDFPMWPRLMNENIMVKVPEVGRFCKKLGLSEEAIASFLKDLEA